MRTFNSARGKARLIVAVMAAFSLAVISCGPGGPKPIRLYGPGSDSGTFDFFTEAIVGEDGASRTDYTPSEEDNFLVLGVIGDANSLGYVGYAYYVESAERLKLVAVDSGNGCVLPSHETINDGTYAPLSRALFIYVNKASLDRPEVRAFVKFYMENGGELATEVGYVPLPDNIYEENLVTLQENNGATAVSGSLSGDINVDGSSTVFPITQAVAEEFREDHSDVQVSVAVSGTGGGFQRFVSGETDISNASRTITESERAAAAENGIEFIELRVALDGISVITNSRNDFVECLTVEELKRIWEPGSTVDTWVEVRETFPK